MTQYFKPGERKPETGTYIEVGPRGGAVPNAREAKSKVNEPLPPTQKEGNQWKKK